MVWGAHGAWSVRIVRDSVVKVTSRGLGPKNEPRTPVHRHGTIHIRTDVLIIKGIVSIVPIKKKDASPIVLKRIAMISIFYR